jgi:hypothetical protein
MLREFAVLASANDFDALRDEVYIVADRADKPSGGI